jgi:biopolymer transport protein ExbD
VRRIGKKKQGDIEPDLTSFSDIANLLIIFFILTTTLSRPWGRRVDMPGASTPPQASSQQSDTPTINLMRDRVTFSDGSTKEREVTMGELRKLLWQKNFPSLDEKKRSVSVETANDVPYERYYQVVTAIAAAGGVVAILSD